MFTADLSRCSDAVLRMLSQVAVGVDVPALAGRGQSIPSIVQALLAEIEPPRRPVLSAATMQVLMRWDWPGNVAELRQVLLSLAAELPGQSVSPYHLPERMWDAANRRPLTRIESAERTEILAALRQSGGNRSKAASLLGIGRTTLYRKLTRSASTTRPSSRSNLQRSRSSGHRSVSATSSRSSRMSRTAPTAGPCSSCRQAARRWTSGRSPASPAATGQEP